MDAALRGQAPHDLVPRSPPDDFGHPDLLVPEVQQQTLTFDRQAVWQTLPEPVQQQCTALIRQLLRAVLEGEASTRRDDDRQDPARPS